MKQHEEIHTKWQFQYQTNAVYIALAFASFWRVSFVYTFLHVDLSDEVLVRTASFSPKAKLYTWASSLVIILSQINLYVLGVVEQFNPGLLPLCPLVTRCCRNYIRKLRFLKYYTVSFTELVSIENSPDFYSSLTHASLDTHSCI